jgi:hypothetical protein
MKRYLVALCLFLGAVGILLVFQARRPLPPHADDPAANVVAPTLDTPAETAPPAPTVPTPDPKGSTSAPNPPLAETQPKRPRPRLTIKAGDPIPELFPFQAERQQLYALAASNDPQAIPTIAASLKHPDVNVREAARQALLQTGSTAAIPHLETAASSTSSPEERALLREAIEFLSLPSFVDVITSPPPPASGAPSTP